MPPKKKSTCTLSTKSKTIGKKGKCKMSIPIQTNCETRIYEIDINPNKYSKFIINLSNNRNNRFRLKYDIKGINSPNIINRRIISNQTTASESIVILYNLRNGMVVIRKQSKFKDQLENEYKIYKLVNNLVFNKICPFFFTSLKKPLFYTREINSHPVKHIDQFMESDRHVISKLRHFYINRRSNQNIKTILYHLFFQIFYSILCLHSIGIAHRDMHFENIFIIQSNNTAIKYITNQGTFYVPTLGFEVRIYDFDQSYKSDIQTNNTWNKISKIILPDHTPYSSLARDKVNQYRCDIYKLLLFYEKEVHLPMLVDNNNNSILDTSNTDQYGRKTTGVYPNIQYSTLFDLFDQFKTPIDTTYTCDMTKLGPSYARNLKIRRNTRR